jgi:lysophospholipase
MDEFKYSEQHSLWVPDNLALKNGLNVRLCFWNAVQQKPIRVLVLPGSRDCVELYSFLAERLDKAGHQAFAMDWPGHGKSERIKGSGDLEYVHANDFAKDYFPALEAAIEKVRPHAIIAHSMGAGITLGYYTQTKIRTPLVVTAPFMDLASKHGPRWLTEYGPKVACLLGMGGDLAWGQKLFSRPAFEPGNELTSDEYAFKHKFDLLAQPSFKRGGVTYGFVAAFQRFRDKYLTEAELARIEAQVLGFITPKDQVVSGPAQQKLRAIRGNEVVELLESQHEPLRERPEIRNPVIQRICDFLPKPL